MPTDEDMELEPLHVRVVNEGEPPSPSADWGSFQAILYSATSNIPQQILAFNKRRLNAYIIVQGTTGFVRVGTRAQVMNNAGAQLTPPIQVKYEAQQEVWAVGDGVNAFTVNVLDHRYA
jgi:hypothetical protein